MNREYAIFKSAQFGNPAILDKNKDDGVTFCAKSYDPYPVCGVYMIVHAGLDKKRRPYRIAEPVFEIPYPYYDIMYLVQRAVNRSNGDKLYDNEASIQETRLNRYFKRGDNAPITVEWLKKILKKTSMHTINDIITRRSNTDGVDFELKHIRHNYRYSPIDDIHIRYVNGEMDIQSASWVYKHKNSLVNWSIIVRGDTVNNLTLEFVQAQA